MKILILGSTGIFGSECKNILGQRHEIICPDRNDLDIISWDRVIETFDQVSPDVVLNCAGFTNLEACETEEFAVRKINVEGPRNLAQASARFGCRIVHISCGHIFDGQKAIPQPYFEDDAPNPLSAYGKSKWESETAIRGNSPNYIILRSFRLYGIYGKDFMKSILAKAIRKRPTPLRIPDDQICAPTWTYRLALQIEELLNTNGRGTYHATAEGHCSLFEFVKYVLDKLAIRAPIEPCSMKDLTDMVPEPANCLLENRLSKKQGVNIMVDWQEDLDEFLDKFGKTLIKTARQL